MVVTATVLLMTSIGQIAYEAYVVSAGGVSAVTGAPLPTWEQQASDIQGHWEAAADAVAAEVVCRKAHG